LEAPPEGQAEGDVSLSRAHGVMPSSLKADSPTKAKKAKKEKKDKKDKKDKKEKKSKKKADSEESDDE